MSISTENPLSFFEEEPVSGDMLTVEQSTAELSPDELIHELELGVAWQNVAPEAMDLAAVNVDVLQQLPLAQPQPATEKYYGREQTDWVDPTLLMPHFYMGGDGANGEPEVDAKDLIDATPKDDIQNIADKYYVESEQEGFSWYSFYKENFEPPVRVDVEQEVTPGLSLKDQLESTLTSVIKEHPEDAGTLLATKGLNIYPGVRFSEGYYWDQQPVLEWLLVNGHVDIAEQQMKSLSGQVEQYGFIPNGTRTYYLDRSQPAVFGGMVKTMAEYKAGTASEQEDGFNEQVYKETMAEYLQPMMKEHNFWMNGRQSVDTPDRHQEVLDANGEAPIEANRHVVSMPDGSILNRYWSSSDRPRPESFRHDVNLAIAAGIEEPFKPNEFYREINAGAASGADFMADRFADGKDMRTIQSTNLVTVELNSLLYDLEQNIADAQEGIGNTDAASYYHGFAKQRADAMNKYLWDDGQKWYMDYMIKDPSGQADNGVRLDRPNLFGSYPMASGIVNAAQAAKMGETINGKFLRGGGLIMNLNYDSIQQWDGENMWAPPHMRTIKGLFLTGQTDLARTANDRFAQRAEDIYDLTGANFEKHFGGKEIRAGHGGEYDVVHYLSMMNAAVRVAQEIRAENKVATRIALGHFAAKQVIPDLSSMVRMPRRDSARAV